MMLTFACSSESTSMLEPPTPFELDLVSGSGQTDTAGAILPHPLIVRVLGHDQLPAAGEMVIFEPTSGSGTVNADTVITGPDGLAQATWTLGMNQGLAEVQASLHETSVYRVTFSATVNYIALQGLAIVTGYDHSCAISPDHRLYCWGENGEGQLGIGTTVNSSVAVPVSGALLFSRVAAGMGHTCATTTVGELFCWGRNAWGELGDGSLVSHMTPTSVSTSERFVDVVAGGETTCALSTTGDVFCWGLMGGSESRTYYLPANVTVGTHFRSLYGSDGGICGLGIDGSPYCMTGTYTSNGLDGGAGSVWRPQPAPSALLTSFTGGLRFGCGLDARGAALCWGDNTYGQLGTGSTDPATGVVSVVGGHSYGTVSSGNDWTCGISTDGPTYCWGHNGSGSIGPNEGPPFVEATPRPLPVPAGLTFTSVDGGVDHMCGLGTDAFVYCWGGGYSGQLGDGHSLDDQNYHRSLPASVLRR
jgi:hypothetical protein